MAQTTITDTPYARWAETYRAAGWLGVLPLPADKKWPPPSGVTGARGRWPTEEDCDAWDDGEYLTIDEDTGEVTGRHRVGNVCLRVPTNVIGLDVDHHGDKTGGDELDALVAKLGPLPDTWISTSRDLPSGIRLFRVVGEHRWSERELEAIDVVRFGHRYVVAAPSLHPEGRPYRWVDPDGNDTTMPPGPDSLPFLPPAWADFLADDRPESEQRRSAAPTWDDQADDDAHPKVTEALNAGIDGLAGNRHPAAVATATTLLRFWSLGYPGAQAALDEFGERFKKAITDPERSGQRSPRDACDEWDAIVDYQTLYVDQTEPTLPHYDGDAIPFSGIDGLRYTESGNADRLVAHHGDVIRYVPLWGAWLAWDSRRWKLDHDDVRVTELAKDVPRRLLARIAEVDDLEERKRLLGWINKSESSGALSSIVRLARTTPAVAVDHGDLDSEPLRLTIANGDLDLRTGRLDSHDPDRLSTKLANVRHDAAAVAPDFERFLAKVIPDDEVRGYLQRFAGYCLTGSVTEQMLGIWFGAGANGKSTLINVLRALLGDYAAIAKRELLVASHHDQHPAALVDLFGARLATCVELREGAALDEARVKSLTGGDTIAARRMRENWWHFEPTHKLLIATNHRPTIRADDPATWRRVHLVPFEIVIPPDEIDRTLGDRIIANEMPGVLNWALHGLDQWQDGGLRAPDRVKYATAEYRADADTVARFMADECIELVPDATCGSTQLREVHERWCEDNGENPRSHWQAVQRRLKELGAEPGRTASYRFWKGVSAVEMTGG